MTAPDGLKPRAKPRAKPEWMSVREVAVYAGRHMVTVRQALLRCRHTNGREGLRGYQRKACASWRIHRADADRWIRGQAPARANRTPVRRSA